MPFLLLAPMLVMNVGASAWAWLVHGGEAEAIGVAMARLKPGTSVEWSANTWMPWHSRLTGVVTVLKQAGDDRMQCRDTVYTVGTDDPQIFRATLCQAAGAGAWRVVQDGSSRLSD